MSSGRKVEVRSGGRGRAGRGAAVGRGAVVGRAARALSTFDRLADASFERRLRGCRSVDVLMYAASAVGDHGMLWSGIALLQAWRRHRKGEAWGRPLLRVAAGLIAESAVVNGPIKWLFRRSRPSFEGQRPLHLRQPRTSSFPSGHASAAFFAAALLRDGDRLWPLYYVAAVVVAASRAHVRIHHASDVIGGMLTGAVLGEALRRRMPLTKTADPADSSGVEESFGGSGG